MLVSSCLFLITIAPQFWTLQIINMPVRFFLWLIPLFVFWFSKFPESPKPNLKPKSLILETEQKLI
jgi:hypothetical protein